MKLADQLLADDVKRKDDIMKLATAISKSEKKYSELMGCFFSPDYRLSQRAAWVMTHVVKLNQKIIAPYLVKMIEQLSHKNIPVAVSRNTLRIVRIIDIPEEVHGMLMNICFTLTEKQDAPVAIKAFSLSILNRLSEPYPEIIDELKIIAQSKLMNEKPAVKNIARKILNNQTKAKPQV